MGKIRQLLRTAALLATMTLISACGGGGGGSASSTISGTAAAGAPIIGTVTIKDSTTPTALTKTVTIAADGKYTVDVSGMKGPYCVRADGYVGGNEYHLYSAATAEDVNKTINVTPLTDLIVANIAGTIAADYFNNSTFSTLTAAQLTAEAEDLKAKLLPTLQAVGVAGSIDLLRASFSTDHSGLDAALDVIRVETDPTTKVATITNIINNDTMTSNLTTGTYTGALDDSTGVTTGATAIQQINAGFKAFSDLFATSVPAADDSRLLALFDAPTFLQSGQDLASFLSERVTDPMMVGVSFTNISLQFMNTAQDQCIVAFDVIVNGKPIVDGPRPWSVVKKNGRWLIQGDQRIAEVSVQAQAEYRVSDVNTPIITGLQLDIVDRGGSGIDSAVVTGAGLPTGGVTLVKNIAFDFFELSGQNGNSLYSMTDTAIGAVADAGEIYTVQLYTGQTLVATYTEKLRKRPYLRSELSPASFPAITSPTVTALHSFTGGSMTVNWTLPAGLTNDWISAQIADNAGNSAKIEFNLLPAERSKTGTLNPVTSTGQSFTITNGWIWLGAWDSFGRSLATTLW